MDRRLDINLLPPEFQPQPALRWHPMYLAALYGLSLFLVLYVLLSCLNKVQKAEVLINVAKGDIMRLQSFSDAYDLAQDSIESLQNLKHLFVYLDKQYVDWPLFFYHLKPTIPEGVWLRTVKADVVTKAAEPPPATAPAPAPAPAAGQGNQDAAPATPPKPPAAPAPPAQTGDIVMEGLVNGYSLIPLAAFIKNLQDNPYFTNVFLQESSLSEDESLGVTRSFRIIVRVKDYEQALEKAAGKQDGKSPGSATPPGEGANAQ